MRRVDDYTAFRHTLTDDIEPFREESVHVKLKIIISARSSGG